jgi:hypothetical protein
MNFRKDLGKWGTVALRTPALKLLDRHRRQMLRLQAKSLPNSMRDETSEPVEVVPQYSTR